MPGTTLPKKSSGQSNNTPVWKYYLLGLIVVAASSPYFRINTPPKKIERPQEIRPLYQLVDLNNDGLEDILLLNYDIWSAEGRITSTSPIMALIKGKDGNFHDSQLIAEKIKGKDYVTFTNYNGRPYRIERQEYEKRIKPPK